MYFLNFSPDDFLKLSLIKKENKWEKREGGDEINYISLYFIFTLLNMLCPGGKMVDATKATEAQLTTELEKVRGLGLDLDLDLDLDLNLDSGVYIIQIIDIFAPSPFFQNDIFFPKYSENFLFPPFFSTSYPLYSHFFSINHHIFSPTNQ